MWTKTQSEREKQLQREVDDLRYERYQERLRRDREQDAWYLQREAEREERLQQAREDACHAEDWPEAFRKGLPRAREAAREEAADWREYEAHPELWEGIGVPNSFFREWVEAIEAAQVIYREEMAEVEKQIAALRQAALERIAQRVESLPSGGELAEAFRENNPEYLTYW